MAKTFSLKPGPKPPPYLSRAPKRPEELTVGEHLNDMQCSVGDDILMECRIDGPNPTSTLWYKNGCIVRTLSRHRVSVFRNWHRLEIIDIRQGDRGVYSIVCSNAVSQAFTSATLFVPNLRLNEVAYYSVSPYECTRIVRHLTPVTINVGERIRLETEVETYVHIKHYWYKDDVPISGCERVQIENCNAYGRLIIEEAKPEDSGAYVLVMKTKEGALASYTNVHVLKDIDQKKIALPVIVEHLKRDLDVTESQYVKLLCRGIYDIDTTVSWYRNDIHIKDCQLLQHDYGNGYTALKILDTFPALSGTYKVVLHNEKLDKLDVSTCNLNIHRSNLTVPIYADIVKPLESAVAACGSRVVLDCTFCFSNHTNVRVVWFVGRYKVERSNRLFSLSSKGGNFVLHIKKMAIGMIGEVICEIHQWEQSPKYVHVSQSMANLTMVPPGFIRDNFETGDRPPKHYDRGSHSTPKDFFDNIEKQHQQHQSSKESDSKDDQPKPGSSLSPKQICSIVPIKFRICRLTEEGHYYFYTKPRSDGVQLFYNHPTRTLRNKGEVAVFNWYMKHELGTWYCVSCQLDDGSFRELGVTSTPTFQVEGPVVDRMLVFQISPTLPVCSLYSPLLRFKLDTELQLRVPPNRGMLDIENFAEWYSKTEDFIGGGAFGKVALVEDCTKEVFAVKFIKTHERNKTDFALREFFTLRKLTSMSVVTVIDVYVHPKFIVLVMEYLSGGELFDRIVRDKHVHEADVGAVIKQVCEALIFIHSLNVVHLDLKPENIVFTHRNSMTIKLVDLGLSRVIFDGSKIRAVYGTREYVAPEVLNFQPVHLNSDMWSLGVVVFMLLSGTMPFTGDTEEEQSAKITVGQYNFDNPAFRTISDVGKDFIERLLVVSPRRRYNTEEAVKHTWLVYGPPTGSTTGSLKLARARLKAYMHIYKAKWEVINKPLPRAARGLRLNRAKKIPNR